MSVAVETAKRIWTEAELEALPEDGFTHEVVNGELMMSPNWIINPETESVEIGYSLTQRKLLGSGAFLEGETLLPGFKYAIADLFKEWDWD